MAVDIAQRITDTYPRTEGLMIADSDIDYPAAKFNAIASAKRAAYGTTAAPAEASIPDLVAEWIADKATTFLIPIAKEMYALTRNRSKSNRAGDNISNYDLIAMLDGLKAELDADCASRWPVVEDLVGRSLQPRSTPQVSVDGMMLDPMIRAQTRGVPW